MLFKSQYLQSEISLASRWIHPPKKLRLIGGGSRPYVIGKELVKLRGI